MRAKQLWLPCVGHPMADNDLRADLEMAFSLWNGQTTVWLAPDTEQPAEFDDGKTLGLDRNLIVPSRLVDRLDVFHIGENGFVWGRDSAGRFPGGCIGDLLHQWLDTKHYRPRLVQTGRVQLSRPTVLGGLLWSTTETIEPTDGPKFRVVTRSESKKTTLAKLELVPQTWSTVAPSLEVGGADTTEITAGETRNTTFRVQWPPPFCNLFPSGGNADDLYERARMIDVLAVAKHDNQEALRLATAAAMRYRSQGSTNLGLSWFWPNFLELKMSADAPESQLDPLKTAIERGASLGLNVSGDPIQVLKSEQWTEKMNEPVVVPRVVGLSGLMWELLLEHLERARSLTTCRRCGRGISGKKGKQYCGRADNLECYRRRLAENRRRERERKAGKNG